MSPSFGTVNVHLRLYASTPDEGGRRVPLVSGYRPTTKFYDPESGEFILVGLGSLLLVGRDCIRPGETAPAIMAFQPQVGDLVMRLTSSNSTLELTEGYNVVARGEILNVTRESEPSA